MLCLPTFYIIYLCFAATPLVPFHEKEKHSVRQCKCFLKPSTSCTHWLVRIKVHFSTQQLQLCDVGGRLCAYSLFQVPPPPHSAQIFYCIVEPMVDSVIGGCPKLQNSPKPHRCNCPLLQKPCSSSNWSLAYCSETTWLSIYISFVLSFWQSLHAVIMMGFWIIVKNLLFWLWAKFVGVAL